MASNLVTSIEDGYYEALQTFEGHNNNVTHITSIRDYSLNIDRTLRNKINACERAFVEYACTVVWYWVKWTGQPLNFLGQLALLFIADWLQIRASVR